MKAEVKFSLMRKLATTNYSRFRLLVCSLKNKPLLFSIFIWTALEEVYLSMGISLSVVLTLQKTNLYLIIQIIIRQKTLMTSAFIFNLHRLQLCTMKIGQSIRSFLQQQHIEILFQPSVSANGLTIGFSIKLCQ